MSTEQGDIYSQTLSVFSDVDPREPLTTPEVANRLDAGRRTVHKRLTTLADRDELRTKKVGASGRVWWRPDAPEVSGSEADSSPGSELERYKRIIDAVGDPVYELDRQGRFTYVNQAAVDLSGYSRSELLGESVAMGMDAETIAETESVILDLVTDDSRDSATLEYEVTTKGGERVPVENHLTLLTDEDGTIRGTAGVLRDISDQKDREETLRRTADLLRHTERLANVGGWELDVSDPPYEATWTEQLFDIFEVEKQDSFVPEEVLSYVHPEDRARVRRETIRLRRETDSSIEDGEAFVQEYRILTAKDTLKWIRAISEPADDGSVVRGATMDVTERKAREQELEEQRARLTALNDLNEAVRGVTEAVVEQSTREEIERTTCERLAAADSYSFAWVAEVDPETSEIRPRVEVGVDGYLDDVELSADPDTPTGQGPAGRAVRTGEMHAAANARTNAEFEPWHDVAREYGYQSAAAIPIVHDGTVYGLVGIYSDRPDGFSEAERNIVGQIGEVVGHAIAAVERKHALDTEEVTEISFQVRDVFRRLGVTPPPDGAISVDQTVHVENDKFLAYGETTERGVATLQELVESDAAIHWDGVTILESDDDRTTFEARWTDQTILATIASAGGHVSRVVLEDDRMQMTVHLASEADVQALVDSVTTAYPDVELLTRRRTDRAGPSPGPLLEALSTELTDRQAMALKAGYFSGFFEWPRRNSGEEVAQSLDISASTFHQHLRKAEKELLDLVFEEQ